MKKLSYRFSKNEDSEIISELLSSTFGLRENMLTNIEHRYFLGFDGNELIAITGLCNKNSGLTCYDGYEIDWTCVRYDYQHKGIITHMLKNLISNIDDDIYCSCWKETDKINLHHAMHALGFTLLQAEKKNCNYSMEYTDCLKRRFGCKCFDDLYIKRK